LSFGSDEFLFLDGLFSGTFAVSFREDILNNQDILQINHKKINGKSPYNVQNTLHPGVFLKVEIPLSIGPHVKEPHR